MPGLREEVAPTRFELVAYGLGNRRSVHLSYGAVQRTEGYTLGVRLGKHDHAGVYRPTPRQPLRCSEEWPEALCELLTGARPRGPRPSER